MGLLDQLAAALGSSPGGDVLDRVIGGNHNVHDPAHADQQQFGQVIQQVPRDQLARLFGQAARQLDPQQYRDHVTPGTGGTNPLGALKGPALAAVASALVRHLAGGTCNPGGGMTDVLGAALASPGGVSGNGAGGLDALLQKVPGLSTTDPHRMNEHELAALADYTRQHEPDAFGRAMADVGHEQPAAVGPMLGNQGLSSFAGQLARLLGGRR